MAPLRRYSSGQAAGRDQTIRQATRVTLLEDNPEGYDRESLQALAHRPFTIEEWLLVTDDYLVYRTSAAVMEHLRQVLLRRAGQVAGAAELLDAVASQVDAAESSVWLPLKGAHARPWVFEGQAAALLGSKAVPFHYYEIRVGPGALYFLQQPVGHKRARRDFAAISQLLRQAAAP